MNKFFVTTEVYNDRIDICKACVYYFKPTGSCKVCKCFMKIKARIAPLACPQKYWNKSSEVETPDDIPKEIVEEIILLWPDLKTGRAKNQAAKSKLVEIYNTIHNTNYDTHTNCGSCLATCFDGIKRLYEKYT